MSGTSHILILALSLATAIALTESANARIKVVNNNPTTPSTTTTTNNKGGTSTNTRHGNSGWTKQPSQTTPQTTVTEQPVEEYDPLSSMTVSYDANSKEIRYGLYSYKFVFVKGGSFSMGSPLDYSDAETIERPTHRVDLYGFRMGETEVPQWLWTAVLGNNPSSFEGEYLPVESVDYRDCMEFIDRLNELTGCQFALPTEAQWEYAARAGLDVDEYNNYSGSNYIGDVAWYAGNSEGTTHKVGSLQPNILGLYDLSGNVSEWCSDWYSAYTRQRSSNPTGPVSGHMHVYRSGSYEDDAVNCRVAKRFAAEPEYAMPSLGLRLVMK